MIKIKYHYNTQTLRYEHIEVSLWAKIWRVLGFISSTVVFAIIIIAVAYTFFDSPKEKQLKREINQLSLQYQLLNQHLEQMNVVLGDLQGRDDNIYRVIFESEPIPSSVRNAGYGGSMLYKQLEGYQNSTLMIETSKKLEKIRRQLYIQSKSYDEIAYLVKNREKFLSSIPAIQPINNKNLKRMASGYGYRIDPFYKIRKFHYGIDFTADRQTEIYATGNGVIQSIRKSRGGYGNHIVIDHGFGFKTLYAHMSSFIVKQSQEIKRGELIGYVGNTGKSTAPHLHYEVWKDNKKINPINYFYNDLTPEEYDMMVELVSRNNQSFD